jgi:hypothetical protein
MRPSSYLVFGDLHGRVLPAFRLAQAWSREHGVPLDGWLQVGDLGAFPDSGRFYRATRRHAERDSLEGGVQLVTQPSEEADAIFADEACPGALWFTAGNHEDYESLADWERAAGRGADCFAIDAYGKVRCIRDGHVAGLPGDLRVGALWGIDDRAPRPRADRAARPDQPPRRGGPGRRPLRRAAVARFAARRRPRRPRQRGDRVGPPHRPAFVRLLRPLPPHRPSGRGDFGETRVYHLGHLELRSRAEEGSVGLLTWDGAAGDFAYLDAAWLRTVTRHNWKHR